MGREVLQSGSGTGCQTVASDAINRKRMFRRQSLGRPRVIGMDRAPRFQTVTSGTIHWKRRSRDHVMGQFTTSMTGVGFEFEGEWTNARLIRRTSAVTEDGPRI